MAVSPCSDSLRVATIKVGIDRRRKRIDVLQEHLQGAPLASGQVGQGLSEVQPGQIIGDGLKTVRRVALPMPPCNGRQTPMSHCEDMPIVDLLLAEGRHVDPVAVQADRLLDVRQPGFFMKLSQHGTGEILTGFDRPGGHLEPRLRMLRLSKHQELPPLPYVGEHLLLDG